MNHEAGIMNQDENTLKINSFQDLSAWKEAHFLVLMAYDLTKHFPRDEQFALTSQLRRAVVSITSNIAEGFSKGSYKEKIQFYSIAHGSLSEVQSQLLVARDVGYITPESCDTIMVHSEKVSKILNGLIKKSKTFV